MEPDTKLLVRERAAVVVDGAMMDDALEVYTAAMHAASVRLSYDGPPFDVALVVDGQSVIVGIYMVSSDSAGVPEQVVFRQPNYTNATCCYYVVNRRLFHEGWSAWQLRLIGDESMNLAISVEGFVQVAE